MCNVYHIDGLYKHVVKHEFYLARETAFLTGTIQSQCPAELTSVCELSTGNLAVFLASKTQTEKSKNCVHVLETNTGSAAALLNQTSYQTHATANILQIYTVSIYLLSNLVTSHSI